MTINGKQEPGPMWRECVPPQAPAPVVVDAVVAEPTRKILFFSDIVAWWRNARERKLRAKIARLEAKLVVANEMLEQLALANEMMRQWVLASAATAAGVTAMLGGKPLDRPPPSPAKRTGAYG